MRLIDFWSVPHFLSGVVAALATAVFGLQPVPVFIVVLVAAVTWEILESVFRLGESSRNVISDIVLPLISFPVTFLLASRPEIQSEHRILLLVIAFSVYAYTNLIAWQARSDGDSDFRS